MVHTEQCAYQEAACVQQKTKWENLGGLSERSTEKVVERGAQVWLPFGEQFNHLISERASAGEFLSGHVYTWPACVVQNECDRKIGVWRLFDRFY